LSFEEFIKNCNKFYEDELFPKMTEESSKSLENLEQTDQLELGNILGVLSGNTMRFANYVAISQIKAYHQWLVENFELVPKK